MGKYTSVTSEKVRSYIPDELAFCILSKLPIKSLKRFGCICKSWALYFENHKFMHVFRNNFLSNHHAYYDDTSLLLRSKSNDFYSLSGDGIEIMEKLNWQNPLQEEGPYFSVLDSGSITGIICLYRFDGRVVLWNPTIEEYKIIPTSPLSVSPDHKILVKPHGFGYDQVRDDYKLIRSISYLPIDAFIYDYYGISYSDGPEDLLYYPFWEIYSLRSNSWRKLDLDVSVFEVLYSVAGERLYMNGICHWWHSCATHNGADLASFNLANEVLVKTPILLDITSSVDPWRIHLMALNGSIALISWIFGTTNFNISILCEVGVKESWTKLFTIGPLSCLRWPIGVSKKGDIFFENENDEIVFFSLSTQKVEELGVKSENVNILFYKKNILQLEE